MLPTRFTLAPQPDHVTCGPACLALDVHDVASMCGTDDVTGTTHDRLATGLAGLGIAATPKVGHDAAVDILASAREGDALPCRTLTWDAPHWVLATPVRPDAFRILDPWTGERTHDADHVLRLVAPRDHEVWLVPGGQRAPDVRIEGLSDGPGSPDDAREEALAMAEEAFGSHCRGVRDLLSGDGDLNWYQSRAVRIDGRTVGVYLLAERGVRPEVEPSAPGSTDLDGRCVEGVALVVRPEARGRGYGRLLRAEPQRMGYDHVWGEQLHTLGNLAQWRRHRTVVGSTANTHVTAADLRVGYGPPVRPGWPREVPGLTPAP